MACGCGKTSKIKSSPPYANLNDVMEVLSDLCENCVVEVPNGTDPIDFETEGWGTDGYPECCQELTVYVAETEEIWKSKDGVAWCQICGGSAELENRCVAVVPPTTAEADFITVGFGGIVPSGCKELIVLYSDNSDGFIQVAGASDWNSIVKRKPPVFGRRYITGGTLMPEGVGGAVFGTIDGAKSTDPLGLFGVSGRTLTIPANVAGKLQVVHNVITNPSSAPFSTHYTTSVMNYFDLSTTYEYSRGAGFSGTNTPAGQYAGVNNIAIFTSIEESQAISFNVFASVNNTPIVYETISYIYWED